MASVAGLRCLRSAMIPSSMCQHLVHWVSQGHINRLTSQNICGLGVALFKLSSYRLPHAFVVAFIECIHKNHIGGKTIMFSWPLGFQDVIEKRKWRVEARRKI